MLRSQLYARPFTEISLGLLNKEEREGCRQRKRFVHCGVEPEFDPYWSLLKSILVFVEIHIGF